MNTQELAVRLFGNLELRWGDSRLQTPTRKAAAAIAWLSMQDRPATREDIAVLLWGPGRLRNVRQELFRIRKLPGAVDGWLRLGDEGSVSVRADVDRQPPEDWDGAFLRDLSGLNAPAFQHWRQETQLVFIEQWAAARKAAAEAALESHRFEDAAAILDRILIVLPEDPDALALRTRAAAASGDRYGEWLGRAKMNRSFDNAGTLSRLADRLNRILAIRTSEDAGWPGEPADVPMEALAVALGISRLDLADALDELQAAGRIDAALNRLEDPVLPGAGAALLHENLAEALDAVGAAPEMVGWHFEKAGRRQDATEHYLRAAHEDAPLDWPLQRARRICPDGPRKAEVLSLLIEVLRTSGDMPGIDETLDALDRLAVRTQSLTILSAAARQRATEAYRRGNLEDAARFAEDFRKHAAVNQDPVDAAKARLLLGAIAHRSGARNEAIAHLEAARDSGDDAIELQILNALGAIYAYNGDLLQARQMHEKALQMARIAGELAVSVRLLNNLGATAERMSDYPLAERYFSETVTLGRRLADANILRTSWLNLAQVYLNWGRLGRCRELVRRILNAEPLPREEGLAWMLRAHLELLCGRADEALGWMLRGKERFVEMGETGLALNAKCSILRMQYLQQPNPALADALLETIDEMARVGRRLLADGVLLEAALTMKNPAQIKSLLARVEQTGPHAELKIRAATLRLGLLQGECPEIPDFPDIEVTERLQMLALCARVADSPEPWVERAKQEAERQAEGLLTSQREGMFNVLDRWLNEFL
ncbi:MAG: tetratricopeptide repeat protein [Myxococcota bacterium]